MLTIDKEFSALIPPLSAEEFDILKSSIVNEGCRDALLTWNGMLIDGHNRYKICGEYNIPYRTIQKEFHSREEAKIWIIRNQFGRRNLSAYQRSLLALQLEGIISMGKETGRRDKISVFRKTGETVQNSAPSQNTRSELAGIAGVSHDTIMKVKKIQEAAPEAVKAKLISGEIHINKAYNDIKREEKRTETIAKLDDITAKEAKAAEGVYDVLVIDPPWPMQKIERDVRPNQTEFDYPTMEEEELSKLNIPYANDCHVWLWTTHKFMPMAFRLLSQWGLKYVCTFVWHKPGGFQPIGLPQYNCEFALYARKGSPIFIDTKAFNTCFNAPRGVHSEKPEEFYDTIRRTTAGRRLDMFNRREIDGFDTWGNESC